MMSEENRPMLSPAEQIAHLKSKGIRFDLISEQDALSYLQENNNYFKLRAYRKNFPKHPDGEKRGQYIGLDFAMLKDIAIIDMHLRYTMIHMTLDIEHYARVKLVASVYGKDDGYQIVQDYLDSKKKQDSPDRYNHIMAELNRNRKNPYCGGLIEKYSGKYPIWAFVEVITLGTFIDFYRFCGQQIGDKELVNDSYLLSTMKELRNAAAHNNCVLNELGRKDCEKPANYRVLCALRKHPGISKAMCDNELKKERIRQIVTTIYTHSKIVSSSGVRNRAQKALQDFSERMFRHADYYRDNETVLKSFDFLKKAVDIFTDSAYNINT